MSDEADMAGEAIELNRQRAIEACRSAPSLPPKGSCWFCDEAVPPPLKFCDGDCVADYEHEQAALMRAGRLRPAEHVED